jgi:6-pyruvoyltetrahydropterin/6-carboxytetrahydropterin synthase
MVKRGLSAIIPLALKSLKTLAHNHKKNREMTDSTNNTGKLTVSISDDTIKAMKDLHGIDAITEVTTAVAHELQQSTQGAEERRVFYIDVGNMTPEQAQAAMKVLGAKFNSAYNPVTMGEDYFFSTETKKKFLSTKTFNTDRGLSCCFRQWKATHSHCSTLHGYSIGVKFVFECDELDERNWVFDFGGLKDIKKWLEHMFDHTCCVAEDDPLLEQFKAFAATGVMDLRIVPGVGCERFAEMIFDHVTQVLDEHRSTMLNPTARLKSVEVFEHGANSAIVERN